MATSGALKLSHKVEMISSVRDSKTGLDNKRRAGKFRADCAAIYEHDVYAMKIAGFFCMIRRNHSGAFCGYIAIPQSKGFEALDLGRLQNALSCHGGITYADSDSPVGDELNCGYAVSMWLGFDCAHSGDQVPISGMVGSSGTYRNVTYVIQQLHDLVVQIELVCDLLN